MRHQNEADTMQNAEGVMRRSKKRRSAKHHHRRLKLFFIRMLFTILILAAAVLLLLYFVNNPLTGKPFIQSLPSIQSEQPKSEQSSSMTITIRESEILIDGKPVSLDEFSQMDEELFKRLVYLIDQNAKQSTWESVELLLRDFGAIISYR